MKTNSPVFAWFADVKERYDESESPVISAFRTVTDKIGSLSEENEFAQVTRQMRILDPGFDVESFTGDLREYILPELLDAYLGADKEALNAWCGEAVRFLPDTFLYAGLLCVLTPSSLSPPPPS